jgi:tRNA-2-methylthio-N6-dimethylallyladenosine synthase
MKRLYVQTYGCQMNIHDTERIIRVMKGAGYAVTSREDEADLVLLNTCSVRDKAEQKVYSALGRWRELKTRSGAVIGVCGCVAQQEGAALLRRVPHLDLVFGPHNIHKLPQMVEEVRTIGRRPVETAFYRRPFYMEDASAPPEVRGPKAFVTIMEGCNKVCSFCIVPYVRGREISRPSEMILAEIQNLLDRGIKEVMLLGQNVNSYGNGGQELTFAALLGRINDFPRLERIRFTTSHPHDLSPELIAAYGRLKKLCEHLHLPVQSGSDRILRRMKRGYTTADYLDRLDRLRDRCPDVALSTDIIVGFPGETEEDFEQTLEMMTRVQYDDAFVFSYSARPHTAAARLFQDDVAVEEKKARLKKALDLQSEISMRKNRALIGAEQEILIEGESKMKLNQLMGRTRANKIVNVPADSGFVGELVRVEITHASSNSLLGRRAMTAESRSSAMCR